MSFYIKATAEGGLCGKCRSGQVMVRGSEVKVHCSTLGKFIPRALDVCSEFAHKGSPHRWEFEETAWILEVNKGKVIGFKPPKPD